jgi:hypothetical protein
MNLSNITIIAFLGALAAFVFLPVSAVAASIAVSVIGIASILAADYGRGVRPLRVSAPAVPVDPARPALNEYSLAA